jgi:hypothetical protein
VNAFPQIRPIANAAHLAAIEAAAREDNHGLHVPTHVFERAGEIVGAASIGAAVTVLFWGHTQKLSARDTFGVVNSIENSLRLRGVPELLVPVHPNSPLAPSMAGLGYNALDSVTLFAKRL